MKLSVFGPMSTVVLIAVWALFLILGFGLVVLGSGTSMNGMSEAFYFSGVTLLTLGYGDLTLDGALGHLISVLEAGIGFGFLAVLVSYLPVLYQSFSRREVMITLMDALGGSPPSGGEMLLRFARDRDWEGLQRWLERWETWAAELLETHLSYPILASYRSQHADTSWLCAMTAVMDACALMIAAMPENRGCQVAKRQALLTFAMCRHAAIDISQVFHVPAQQAPDRLDRVTFNSLARELQKFDVELGLDDRCWNELTRFRATYEPVVASLSVGLRLSTPSWTKNPNDRDNWESGLAASHL